LSTILAVNSIPKNMPIPAPKMTAIRIMTPVTCVSLTLTQKAGVEGLQAVFAAVYCQAILC
jgi:hypothetical protein